MSDVPRAVQGDRISHPRSSRHGVLAVEGVVEEGRAVSRFVGTKRAEPAEGRFVTAWLQ